MRCLHDGLLNIADGLGDDPPVGLDEDSEALLDDLDVLLVADDLETRVVEVVAVTTVVATAVEVEAVLAGALEVIIEREVAQGGSAAEALKVTQPATDITLRS